jgi:hypothetical protein
LYGKLKQLQTFATNENGQDSIMQTRAEKAERTACMHPAVPKPTSHPVDPARCPVDMVVSRKALVSAQNELEGPKNGHPMSHRVIGLETSVLIQAILVQSQIAHKADMKTRIIGGHSLR